jgi:hypothetical protein
MNIFTSHTNSEVLLTCCKVFDFLSGAGDESATRPTIIYEDTLERLNAMSATILNETCDISHEMKIELEDAAIKDLEKDFCEICDSPFRFNYLSQIVIPEAVEVNEVEEDESRTVFSVMHRIFNSMLRILKGSATDAGFYKTEWMLRLGLTCAFLRNL